MKNNLLKKVLKSTAAKLIAAFLMLASSQLQGAITFIGIESGSAADGYPLQNWSNSSVPKMYDVGGEVYGSSGYYQIRPMTPDSPEYVYESAGSGNLLGTDSGTYPTLSVAPSFISSIAGGAGTFVNFGGYSLYRSPDGASLLRQGALSVSVGNGTYNTPSGAANGYYGIAMEFTINTPTTFRFGLVVDTVGTGSYAPDYVGVYSASTGTVFSSLLSRDGAPDMAVFEINALANEALTISVWQLAGTQSIAPFSLATFDAVSVPEPSAASLIAFGVLSLFALRKVKNS